MPRLRLLLASSGAEQPVRSPTFLLEMLRAANKRIKRNVFLEYSPTKKHQNGKFEYFNILQQSKTLANAAANVESKCP